ncbi:uncharacterized protein TRIADDRAFT_61182 [Trichoplax adhaerens]|uniref:MARVEL domain-containing protein n=1 Tax=Trichoplax adhaerens TaxID=10228 RepID=B3SA94_TRIAD|nr:predicted protein [Trichoplax adhaerens]EDV20475.1 predicted protein [Trichoplax adhaerens]|eukprot:XP_002117169.1 predicted protein [Trichoplax adhaerens]
MSAEISGHHPYQPESFSYQRYYNNFLLPLHLRPTSLGIGITISVIGFVSIILGGIGYGFHGYCYNPSVVIALDIWVGISYCICGIFAATIHFHKDNHHLMNSYYAFVIISLFFSILQFGISLASMFAHSAHYLYWHNIASMFLGVVVFSLALAMMIILSRTIYCRPAESGNIQNQTVIFQPYPIQTENIDPPAASIYAQPSQNGQFMMYPQPVSANPPQLV